MAGAKVRGITIDLGVDTSQFSSGLKSINSAINSTSKELKDIDKLLKLDPSNVTLLAQKHQALQRAVAQTKDKLELLKNAEEELKSQMVDGGTEEQQKQLAALQREIISTEKNLEKYEGQLAETGEETKDLAQAEEQAEQATGKMKEGFTVLKGAMASLVADGIRKAVDGFKDLMTAGPEFADEMATLAKQTGMSTDTLQEFEYMSGLIDVDVSTIAGSMKKLTKSMSSAKDGTGATADAFATLGVSVTDANGNLRDNEDVFYDTIDALGKMENETERDALSMQLFGKSATDLNPLIEAGSDAMKAFADEAHEMGYVLDEDAIESLSRVQDSFDRFEKQMEGVKNQIAAGVAPAIERGMKKIQDVVRKIDWNKIGKQMGDAFDKLIDALEWIIDHGEVVKSLLVGIVTAMAVKKVASFVSTIMSMTSALKTATIAQEGMNAAANSNPYVLLASALIALTAAAVTFGKEIAQERWEASELGQEIMALQEEMDILSEATDNAVTSFQDMEEAKANSIGAAEAETAHLQSLADELETIASGSGEVTDADKTRADFILGQLNEALGTEFTWNDIINGQYREIIDSINESIEARRAEAILIAQEQAYSQAVTGLSDAQALLAQNVADRITKEQEVAQLESEIAELQAMNASEMSSADEELLENKRIMKDELLDEIGVLESSYAGLADTVDGYVYDINQYESNWAAAHDKNYSAIDTTSWEVAKSMGEASNEYSNAVATSSYKATNKWMEELGTLLSDTTGKNIEFKDAGEGMVSMWVDGIQQGESKPANQVKLMAGMALKEADIQIDMQENGAYAVSGFVNGVDYNSWMASGAGRRLADAFIEAFKAELDEHSPSKVMARSGLFAVLGFTNEVNDNLAMVEQAGINMANAFTDGFNPNANYSAMVAGSVNGIQAPTAMLNGSGSTSNTSNAVTINVYGAEGQSVNALADEVIDKLQRVIIGSEEVYA